MSAIRAIVAKEILDSQGVPTIQVSLWTDEGVLVKSGIPNGGEHLPHEAANLIDNDPEHRKGKGVQKAVKLINQSIAPQLIGKDPTQQNDLDQLLISWDGTEQKTKYGANTLAALSQAIFKAGSTSLGTSVYQRLFEEYQLTKLIHIPTCIFGLVNGGKYGSDNLDLQEFLILPASHIDYRVSLEIESSIRSNLLQLLRERNANYSTGILGGFTPSLQKNTDVFDFIIEAARKTDYILSRDFFFGIDAGAENLDRRGKYVLRDKSTVYSEKEISDYYKNLKEKYNVTYFEDPFTIQDLESWKNFTLDLGATTRIVTDVLTVTNPTKIQEVIQNKYGNSIIIKPSQIGTVTEAIQAVKIAKTAGLNIVVSQRSGETNDDFLADFAVGIGANFVKFGPTNRGESVEKYNRLADIYLEIEQQMLEGENMSQALPQDQSINPTEDKAATTTQAPAPANIPAAAPAAQTAMPTPPADQTQPDQTPVSEINPFETDQKSEKTVQTPTEIPPVPVADLVKPLEEVSEVQPVAETTIATPAPALSLGETPEITPPQPMSVTSQPPMNTPVVNPASTPELAKPTLEQPVTETSVPAAENTAKPDVITPVEATQPQDQVPQQTETAPPKEVVVDAQNAIDSTVAELGGTTTEPNAVATPESVKEENTIEKPTEPAA